MSLKFLVSYEHVSTNISVAYLKKLYVNLALQSTITILVTIVVRNNMLIVTIVENVIKMYFLPQ